ncbi:hypothetical protein H310_00177 [Aphanomyces invadans]|uniref:Uncharacterized protein n=1 Tax=Aphanomyces invadans TaxID=157072 RepID=A0A024UUR0_9STRA|nr:hypothetical protein H310_00177 [Aphanomyces invadans]ETW09662.1 hypothetical protein H310_00177 [Aphanomyces invadans]|eukprot:XP_008861073.1 hypothetical protein H310_00177 [Aphanomyces invadans]
MVRGPSEFRPRCVAPREICDACSLGAARRRGTNTETPVVDSTCWLDYEVSIRLGGFDGWTWNRSCSAKHPTTHKTLVDLVDQTKRQRFLEQIFHFDVFGPRKPLHAVPRLENLPDASGLHVGAFSGKRQANTTTPTLAESTHIPVGRMQLRRHDWNGRLLVTSPTTTTTWPPDG